MEDKRAEEFILYVHELKRGGIEDEEELLEKLGEKFEGTFDEFRWALEMMSTGAFRAAMMSSQGHYPKGNVHIDDHPILRIAFRMAWIESKGEDHYAKYFLRRNVPWWKFWK